MDGGGRHLVGFKARSEALGKARALLEGAEPVGSFRQVDTYFSLGERRLKVRSVEGRSAGHLVYYERPDAGGGKESDVRLAALPDAAAVLDILTRAFPAAAAGRQTRQGEPFHGGRAH